MNIMLDDLDLDILAALQQDGRKRFTEIARVLGVSEGTVRNRAARLEEEGVMQVVGLIDPQKLGFDAPAMISVSVEAPKLEEVTATIATFPEVSYLISVSGEFDLMVEVFCRDREHLADFLNQKLRKIPGVMRTQTSLVLGVHKMSYAARPHLHLPR